MGEQLSVTAGFWQPVSQCEHIHHPNTESTANDRTEKCRDWQRQRSVAARLKTSFRIQKKSLVYMPEVLRSSGNRSGEAF